MHIWRPEGYAGLDFATQQLTLVQPSAELHAHGLDPSRLDPASRARIKEDLFGRHLETYAIGGHSRDQLTCELQEFVTCVQTGARPRVSGSAGRDAVVLAERILANLRDHSWAGNSSGPVGARQVPAPLGQLFQPRLSKKWPKIFAHLTLLAPHSSLLPFGARSAPRHSRL